MEYFGKEMIGILRAFFLFCFALDAGLQDLRYKSISVRTFCAFAALGVLLFAAECGWIFMEQGAAGGMEVFGARLLSFFPGLFLLLLAALCKHAVGSGDACYFLTAACFLPAEELLWVLTAGLLLSSCIGLCMLTACRIKNRNQRQLRLPFAAVLFPAVCVNIALRFGV